MSPSANAPLPLELIDQPLVPRDCDLTGLSYMPLYVDRLMRSRTWARVRRRPELAFHLINMFAAAWRDVPAGSLEDDDFVLCAAAMCSPEAWETMRGDLLRGWQRCEDGRLYHPVLCEGVNRAWGERARMREQAATMRAAKEKKRQGQPGQGDLDLGEPGGNGVHPGTSGPWCTSPPERNEVASNPQENREPEAVAGAAPVLDKAFKPEEEKKEAASSPPLTPLAASRGENPPGPPTRTSPRGSRLPRDWEPGADGFVFARNLGLDPAETLAAFSDHYRSAGTRSPDWHAKFRVWCRVAHDRRRPHKPGKGPIARKIGQALDREQWLEHTAPGGFYHGQITMEMVDAWMAEEAAAA